MGTTSGKDPQLICWQIENIHREDPLFVLGHEIEETPHYFRITRYGHEVSCHPYATIIQIKKLHPRDLELLKSEGVIHDLWPQC